jgi:hypothetical protein
MSPPELEDTVITYAKMMGLHIVDFQHVSSRDPFLAELKTAAALSGSLAGTLPLPVSAEIGSYSSLYILRS